MKARSRLIEEVTRRIGILRGAKDLWAIQDKNGRTKSKIMIRIKNKRWREGNRTRSNEQWWLLISNQ